MLLVSAGATLVAAVLLLGSLVLLHVAVAGLSPLADPVSQYALTPFRAGYWLAAGSAAIAGAGTAILLAELSDGGAAVALLWVFAAARTLIPWFPMDAPGTRATPSGRLHNLLAVAAFATVTAAAFLAAGTFRAAGFETVANVSVIAGIVMAIGSAGVIASRPFMTLRSQFGLFERMIYVGFVGWFLTVGGAVLVRGA
jgi:hypothetical protein